MPRRYLCGCQPKLQKKLLQATATPTPCVVSLHSLGDSLSEFGGSRRFNLHNSHSLVFFARSIWPSVPTSGWRTPPLQTRRLTLAWFSRRVNQTSTDGCSPSNLSLTSS